MAKFENLPWFKFYVVSWLTDPLVRSMNLAERGLFLDLLCIQWREGSLPESLEVIRRIAGVGPLQWEHGGGDTEIAMNVQIQPSGGPPIHEFIWEAFPVCEDGQRRNPKLERIRDELLRVKQAQADGGRRKKVTNKSLVGEFLDSSTDIDGDVDIDPPSEEEKGDSDAAGSRLGSRYVRAEGDVVWFETNDTLGWSDAVVNELEKRFPSRTRKLRREGKTWLDELRGLSNWHATAPGSKKKQSPAQRWLLHRLFPRYEKQALHAEAHKPKPNGRAPTHDSGADERWDERKKSEAACKRDHEREAVHGEEHRGTVIRMCPDQCGWARKVPAGSVRPEMRRGNS